MQIEFIPSIHAVSPAEWNNLCSDGYPFIRHEFLSALEDSGSTTAYSGWQAQHLLVRADSKLVAAAPLFIKSHSYGEYVFDWAWADAFQRYGYSYYPKLISAIPFTPCSGPRLLSSGGEKLADLLALMVSAIQARACEIGASSWHCLFPVASVSAHLGSLAINARLGCQFHWFNRDYHNFDDFLACMASRKRKNIIKERRQVVARGFTFTVKEGSAISTNDWDFFADLYRLTYLKRSGHSGYLQREFFYLLGERLPENTVLITAYQQAKAIAAALFLRDSNTLYGRYWGCLEEFDFLHFETCYYQGIDYAIERGLSRFDGGAQGEHKIQRGFEPIVTWSNHWIAQQEFRPAIEHFLRDEKQSMESYLEEARQHLPFRSGADKNKAD